METMEQRVNRGAALLDEKRPGWWKSVDLARLDLNHCERCVLGQLFGDYKEGRSALCLLSGLSNSVKWSFDCGFTLVGPDVDCGDEEMEKLTQAWTKLIQQRREQQKVSLTNKPWEQALGRRAVGVKV